MASYRLLVSRNIPRWYWWAIESVFTAVFTLLLLFFRYDASVRGFADIRYATWDILHCKQTLSGLYFPRYHILSVNHSMENFDDFLFDYAVSDDWKTTSNDRFWGVSDLTVQVSTEQTPTNGTPANTKVVSMQSGSVYSTKFTPLRNEPKSFILTEPSMHVLPQEEYLRNGQLCILGRMVAYHNGLLGKINIRIKEMPFLRGFFDAFYKVVNSCIPLFMTALFFPIIVSLTLALTYDEQRGTHLMLKVAGLSRLRNTVIHIAIHAGQVWVFLSIAFTSWLAVYADDLPQYHVDLSYNVVHLWICSGIYGTTLVVLCAFITTAFYPRGKGIIVIYVAVLPILTAISRLLVLGCSGFLYWLSLSINPLLTFFRSLTESRQFFPSLGGRIDCYSRKLVDDTTLMGGFLGSGLMCLFAQLIVNAVAVIWTETHYELSDLAFERTANSQQRLMCFTASSIGRRLSSACGGRKLPDNPTVETTHEVTRRMRNIFRRVEPERLRDNQKVIVSLERVSVKWKGVKALHKLNLQLPVDTVTSIVSRSPLFSAVLIGILSGTIRRYTGRISLKGWPKNWLENLASVCTADPILFDNLTVYDNFRIFNRLPVSAELDLMSQELMARARVLHLLARKVRDVSEVQKKLLAIVIALSGPSLISVLEEPLRGIPQRNIPLVLQLVEIGKRGRAVAVITSEPKVSDLLGERIGVESRGKLILIGSPSFLREKFCLKYRLCVTKNLFCRLADIYDALEDLTGPIVMASDNPANANLLFELPRADRSKETEALTRIFQRLDKEKDRLKISGFTLADTTVADMLHLLDNQGSLRGLDVDVGGNQKSGVLHRWLQMHSRPKHSRCRHQVFLGELFSIIMHSWLRIYRMDVSRYLFVLLLTMTIITIILTHYLSQDSLESITTYYRTNRQFNYCTRGSPRLTRMVEPYLRHLTRYPWLKSEQEFLRLKYEFCLDLKEGSGNDSDEIEIHSHPNNAKILREVILALLNVALTKNNQSSSYSIRDTDRSGVDNIKAYLRPDSYGYAIYRMFLVVSLTTLSFYFMMLIYTPYVHRQLFSSGLSRANYFIGTYIVMFLINYFVLAIFLVTPIYIINAKERSLLGLVRGPSYVWQHYLLFLFIISSEFTLFSIAIGMFLPKWITFLHIFFYIYSSNAILTVLEIYDFTPSTWMNTLSSLVIPGSGVSKTLIFVERLQIYVAACLDPFIANYICSWNPYALRTCCHSKHELFTLTDSITPGGPLWRIYAILMNTQILSIIIIIVAHNWHHIKPYFCIKQRRKLKEKIKQLEDHLIVSVALPPHGHESILRETATFSKLPFERLLRKGSVIIKEACLNIDCQRSVQSLVIKPGACFGVLGIEGAGKSSLLKIIRGEQKPDYGQVYVNGVRNCHPSEIGYFSKAIKVPLLLQPIELFLIHARIRNVPSVHQREAVQALATIFGLSYCLHSAIHTLSAGEQRLVAIMTAFVGKPLVVLLDEPTANIDAPTKELIWKAILKIKGHCTIIIATDTLDDFERLSFDKTILMADGIVRMIFKFKDLQLRRGYSLTVRVQQSPLTTDYGNRARRLANDATKRNHLQDLMRPIRNWILHTVPKAHTIVDSGPILELHVVDDTTAMSQLFTLRDFICKQFSYVSEFRIEHLSNRAKLRHLVFNAGFGGSRFPRDSPINPDSLEKPVAFM